MTDRLDVIAAFADGELVAGDELDAALADAAGRAYLIDILALRGLVDIRRADHLRQGYGGPPKLEATGTSVAGGLQPAAKRTLWLSSVAALVVAGVAGGYIAGRQQNPVNNAVRDAGTTSVATVIPAPAPTHVIRMENGVNWNEKAGGN
jgi:hypothetical protein